MSYTPQEQLSITSAIGINSDNVISGSNWVGDIYTGAGEQNDYAYVGVNLQVDEAGTLYFDFSQDGTNWSTYPVAGFTVASGINEVHTAWKGGRYMRPRFVGSGGRTYFRLETYYSNLSLPLSAPLNQAINADQDATVVKSIIAGKNAVGNYTEVPVDSEGNLYVHIQRPSSAFGDLRSTELTPQAQITFPYNINTDIVNVNEVLGGTIIQANSMAVLQTSTNTAGEAKLDSRQILKYRAGLGGLVRYTGLFTTGVVNSEQIIGVGDDEDGFFFGYKDADFGIIIRKNGVDEFIPQTTWNIDVMDGNNGTDNPSNVLLDTTKINVFEIEFQWLGAGQIDFHIEDPHTGHFVPVHRVKYANNNTDPSIYNPSLPLHAHVKNDGNNTNLTLKTASMAAFCEGKSIIAGPIRSFGNLKTIDTEEALFSIRNKSIYATKTNRISSFIKELTVGNDINKLAVIRVYRNATLGGIPVFTDINTTNSPIQTDIAGTTVTGGDILFEATVGKDSGADYTFNTPDIDIRPGDTLTFTAESETTGDVRASAVWVEDI